MPQITCSPEHIFCPVRSQIFKISKETQQCVACFNGHDRYVRNVVLTPNGQFLISSSFDHTIRIWSLVQFRYCLGGPDISPMQHGICENILRGHADVIWDLALSSDGEKLYSASSDKAICEWRFSETSNLRKILCRRFHGHTSSVYSLVLTRDNKTLFSGSRDCMIRQWCTRRGQTVRILGNNSSVDYLRLSSDEQKLFTCSYDGTIRQWTVKHSLFLMQHSRAALESNIGYVSGFVVSQDDKTVYVCCGLDVKMVNFESGLNESCFQEHQISYLDKDQYDPSVMYGISSSIIGMPLYRIWLLKPTETVKLYDSAMGDLFCRDLIRFIAEYAQIYMVPESILLTMSLIKRK